MCFCFAALMGSHSLLLKQAVEQDMRLKAFAPGRIEVTLTEGATRKKMIFSGDLGNVDKPIIRDPFVPPEADIVLLESTYGDRNHQPFSNTRREIVEAINETIARNGNVMIPSFALERAPELLYVLYEAWRDGELPKHAHIYLDSPMAIDATCVPCPLPSTDDVEPGTKVGPSSARPSKSTLST